MIATLVPYFLVCNIMKIEEGAWQYGPEYVFKVEANITAIPTNFNSTEVQSMFNAKLFCRPKETESLHCYFQETYMTDWDSKSSSTKDIGLSNEPFDIKFNQRGIECLIVPADTPNYKINIIRSVVKQLDVGGDLRNKSYGTYDIASSDVEECSFHLQLTEQVLNSSVSGRVEMDYDIEIQLRPELKNHLSNNITIVKERSVEDCNYKEPFFFGSVRRLEHTSKYLEEKLNNSQSHIVATGSHFNSVTRTEGTLGAPIRFKKMKMIEFICLTLVNIQPAKSDALEILNPAKVKIIPDSGIERISASS